jgi:hypothetical protein
MKGKSDFLLVVLKFNLAVRSSPTEANGLSKAKKLMRAIHLRVVSGELKWMCAHGDSADS